MCNGHVQVIKSMEPKWNEWTNGSSGISKIFISECYTKTSKCLVIHVQQVLNTKGKASLVDIIMTYIMVRIHYRQSVKINNYTYNSFKSWICYVPEVWCMNLVSLHITFVTTLPVLKVEWRKIYFLCKVFLRLIARHFMGRRRAGM